MIPKKPSLPILSHVNITDAMVLTVILFKDILEMYMPTYILTMG